ncbi:NrdH-redoxin [Salipaludibacillus keqinensis]|uniref:NrdH-redoxin n=1 Tax=Salipaludibacillus keqinensis TaxID=2045207 RepID=A0A323TGS7_9BACI|nr:glutaredoxin family protein [Salipaludibacillus keqinensis]PYZ91763.1 NrdH-redoxin [Salipaludibacillus keqinensis]
MTNQVIVYSTNDCIECEFVKKMLLQNNIQFEIRDITTNQKYQQEVEKYGYLGVPVTVFGDTAVKGMNPDLQALVERMKEV